MRYRTRLDRLERRVRPVDLGPAFLVVSLDEWPAADRDAFDAGDPAVRDALVERHPADRPVAAFRRAGVRRPWPG